MATRRPPRLNANKSNKQEVNDWFSLMTGTKWNGNNNTYYNVKKTWKQRFSDKIVNRNIARDSQALFNHEIVDPPPSNVGVLQYDDNSIQVVDDKHYYAVCRSCKASLLPSEMTEFSTIRRRNSSPYLVGRGTMCCHKVVNTSNIQFGQPFAYLCKLWNCWEHASNPESEEWKMGQTLRKFSRTINNALALSSQSIKIRQ